MATPPPPQDADAIELVDVLERRGVLPVDLRPPLIEVLQAGNQAADGFRIPEVVRLAAEQTGPYLLRALAQLGTTAARTFERHVLEVVRASTGATVELDANLGGVRFDAYLTDADHHLAVEVRSRVRPEAVVEVTAVQALVRSLPENLPVVLVVAGRGLTPEQVLELRQGRTGTVHVVRWDSDYAFIGQVVRLALTV
jgi:hypothetical protein